MATPCTYCGSTAGPDHLCLGHTAQIVGKVLDGRYQILEVLGHGGMGMVFRAEQTSVHRPVAIKTLHASLAAAPTFFERFRREAEIASQLSHPNVITVFDFGKAEDGTCYYVMELVEGKSLKELVKQDGPLSLRRAVDIIEQAARGLAHAHSLGCVHRDLKPHNIMVQKLDGTDFVKVLDFGLVKALEQDDDERLTSTGQVLGTPQYMPPEQAGGEEVDQRSDLYALGAVLFFTLTGSSPYGAKNVRKALTAALTQPVPSVNSRREGAPVPRAIEEFFRKALAKNKEDRHQSAEELIEDLLDSIANLTDAQLDATPKAPQGVKEGSGSDSSSKSSRSSGGSKPRRTSSLPPGRSRPIAQRSTSSPSEPSRSAVRRRSTAPEIPSLKEPSGAKEGERTEAPTGNGRRILFVAVPVVLLAAGAGFLALRHPSPPTPAPKPVPPPISVSPKPTPPAPKPVKPAMITVELRSDPPGAMIFEGPNSLGQTPTSLRFTRNELHTIELRKQGFLTDTESLDLRQQASDVARYDITLQPQAKPKPKPKPPATHKKHEEDIPIFQ